MLPYLGRRSRARVVRVTSTLLLATSCLLYLGSRPNTTTTSILIENQLHLDTYASGRPVGAVEADHGKEGPPTGPGEMGRPFIVNDTDDSDTLQIIESGYKAHAFNVYLRKVVSQCAV